jgi:predicted nucleic acid-binding protein
VSDFVLDASVALSWFVDNPVPETARKARDLILSGKTALVPALWIFEMANGFVTAGRRKVLTLVEASACCDELEILLGSSLEVALRHPKTQVRDLAASANRHSLTGYDASYLELALSENLPLVTLDKSLLAAAKKAGLPSLP